MKPADAPSGAKLVQDFHDSIDLYRSLIGTEWVEFRDFVRADAFMHGFARRYPAGASDMLISIDLHEVLAPLLDEPIGGSAIVLAALQRGLRVSIEPCGMHWIEAPQ
jgi:hypothetical protein